MIDFTKELNQEQLAVVLTGDGPCLVLAGAGSGKTRTITYRVAYLLERGISPENILLVTFTNKAAAEMIKRVAELKTENCELRTVLPWAGTFHHIAYKILRKYAGVIGYSPNFTILDADDSEALVKTCIKQLAPETGGQKFPSAGVIKGIISYARNAETTIEDVLDLKYPSWFRWSEEIKQIAEDYDKRKRTANSMDFDDLLVNLLTALNQPNVLEKYAQQFQYVLVDEYQDTNRLQASIVKKLASAHNNLLVVGDDAQSIYSFRAADIENILSFPALGGSASGGETPFPEVKVFKLETNYRSSQEILSLANAVIANNVNQYKKNLKTLFQSGAKPELRPQADQTAEADFVVRKITEFLEQGIPPKEIAVLFRASHHSQQLEMALAEAGIAYDYRGGVRFFERAHVKDILSYLRLMNNLADEAAWMRILLKEEGIGPVAAQRIYQAVRTASNVAEIKSIGFDILGDKAKVGWQNFIRVWDELVGVGTSRPAELVRAILDMGYGDYLEAEYMDSRDRRGDVEQLVVFAGKFSDLAEFLAEANLTEDYGQKNQNNKVSQDKKIILSTVHQAKGLEWSAVFVVNLASGAFPNSRAAVERGGIEEERRLFYVAITRAKKHLFLTYPMQTGFSAQGGPASGWGDTLPGPSMFLQEIDSELLDDKSLLANGRSLSLNDTEIEYVDEDAPVKIRPGSFLRDVEDL
ncbi:MAG: UvrD-helicase domain-containing protein [Patescibacteria group bacterium]|nr:UvrD-helicase domain-containing protein [Patescibacteria group bacterium]